MVTRKSAEIFSAKVGKDKCSNGCCRYLENPSQVQKTDTGVDADSTTSLVRLFRLARLTSRFESDDINDRVSRMNPECIEGKGREAPW